MRAFDLMSFPRTKLQEDTRFRILRLIEDNPELSQRELATAVGISVGGVHYVLNALVQRGVVKLGNFSSANDKRRYAYKLTPQGIAEKARLARRFMIRKMAEYAALKKEIEEVGANLTETELAEILAELK